MLKNAPGENHDPEEFFAIIAEMKIKKIGNTIITLIFDWPF